MTHSLTIAVPDEVYQPLLKRAAEAGVSPESLALECVARTIQSPGMSPALQRWAGAIQSNVPDWVQRHDDYLGEAQR